MTPLQRFQMLKHNIQVDNQVYSRCICFARIGFGTWAERPEWIKETLQYYREQLGLKTLTYQPITLAEYKTIKPKNEGVIRITGDVKGWPPISGKPIVIQGVSEIKYITWDNNPDYTRKQTLPNKPKD